MHTLPHLPDIMKHLNLYLHYSRNCRKDLKASDLKNYFIERLHMVRKKRRVKESMDGMRSEL